MHHVFSLTGLIPISKSYPVPREGFHNPFPTVHNVSNSSCLRNAFSDVVLVIVFNFPFYSNIPTLTTLYKNAFPTIMFCGSKETKDYTVEALDVYKGYFAYMCMSRAMEKYPGYSGYLLIGDDVILNYWNLVGLSRNKIWEGPKVPILIEFMPAEKWSWWYSEWGVKTCQKAYHEIWASRKYSVNKKMAKVKNNSVNENVHFRGPLLDIKWTVNISKGNVDWTFLCPRGRSDIFYVPRKFADEFKTLSHIFYKHRSFLEIAVPTMLRMIDKKKNFEYIPGIYLPGVGDRQSEFLWERYNPTLAFIHPFKLNYEHDGALNKPLLKHWIIAYSDSLSEC